MKPSVYIAELLLNPLALSLLFIPLLQSMAIPLVVFAALSRIVLEYLVLFAVNDRDRSRPFVLLTLPAAVLFKDVLLLFVYVLPFFSRSLAWRGSTIRIGKHTLLPFGQENLLLDGA